MANFYDLLASVHRLCLLLVVVPLFIFIFYDGIEERISNPTVTLDEGGNHLFFLILYVEIYIYLFKKLEAKFESFDPERSFFLI